MNELYIAALEVRARYRAGQISRDEAVRLIKPYEDFYNEKVVELAKKYKQKAKRFSFASFMR